MTLIEQRLIGSVAHRRILIARRMDYYTTERVMEQFGVSRATAKRDLAAVREAMR